MAKEEKTFFRCNNKECNKINKGVDECIKPLIEVLNKNGYETVASCCGHRNTIGRISLKSGHELLITNYEQAQEIQNIFPDIHGKSQNKDMNLNNCYCEYCGSGKDNYFSMCKLCFRFPSKTVE